MRRKIHNSVNEIFTNLVMILNRDKDKYFRIWMKNAFWLEVGEGIPLS